MMTYEQWYNTHIKNHPAYKYENDERKALLEELLFDTWSASACSLGYLENENKKAKW